ncbi:MAG: ATP:cob(I)alamin adenosyltransferase, partial [Rubrobacteraceae bacterium]
TEIPKEFVIPGQTRLGALLDISRSVTRRAERSLVAAEHGEANSTPHPHAGRVLNRLSDLLFIVARAADGGQTLSKS